RVRRPAVQVDDFESGRGNGPRPVGSLSTYFTQSLLSLRSLKFTFGTKYIAVEICNPLSTPGSHVEIAESTLNIRRHAVPVELRIAIDQVCRGGIPEFFVEPNLLEFVIECIGLSQVSRIS